MKADVPLNEETKPNQSTITKNFDIVTKYEVFSCFKLSRRIVALNHFIANQKKKK